jgi:hypothetical protein
LQLRIASEINGRDRSATKNLDLPVGFMAKRIPKRATWNKAGIHLTFRSVTAGRILGGEELAVANREEEILTVGREGDLPSLLADLALRHLAPEHVEV